ncbi:leukotriene A-4 hydrolase isoform X1 [Dermacentor variabilis]|uniref:leukotriene A-4 hydrolase isoform X1 n=1 Tax=Dermacentor variabilis TaxID=34621 RepID=UPI003F5B45DA
MANFGKTTNDPHSYARPDQCLVTHIHLEIEIDFRRKVIAGFVDITCEKRSDECSVLVLDTQDLIVKRVQQRQMSKELNFTLAEADPILGSKLEIQLGPDFARDNSAKICVEYETSSSSSALQWLTAQQTAGKLYPYLYSHCEPIHARSMLPCQDTPTVKMPYSALVRAPKELTVLMSAIRQGCDDSGDGATRVTKFAQEVPVPSYLIAIAVGAIESRKIGPRCAVLAEKEQLNLAVIDFADTERMLCSAESLVGPYLWGVYDLLVLPPSFPYGGMENPCLTFATPSLLAGDKSLANVVAHEIAHSWTGNLVTNKTFEHFWLNEGFTVFLERKIIGRLFGNEMREFQALDGIEDLRYTIETLGVDNPLTCLVPRLSGVHPDEAFSSVPYEKGHTFLYYLETLLGGPEVFDKFLLAYIEKYKYQSVDTWQWKAYLYDYFKDKADILNRVEWEAWLHSPGMPPVIPSYSRALVIPCEQLCAKWANPGTDSKSFSPEDISSLQPGQRSLFLSLLLKERPLSADQIQLLTKTYKMEEVGNAEIKFRWLRLGLRAKWDPVVPHVCQFLQTYGRMKFVCPLFRDLHSWEEKRQLTKKLFTELKPQMMHVVTLRLSKDLGLS